MLISFTRKWEGAVGKEGGGWGVDLGSRDQEINLKIIL